MGVLLRRTGFWEVECVCVYARAREYAHGPGGAVRTPASLCVLLALPWLEFLEMSTGMGSNSSSVPFSALSGRSKPEMR